MTSDYHVKKINGKLSLTCSSYNRSKLGGKFTGQGFSKRIQITPQIHISDIDRVLWVTADLLNVRDASQQGTLP